MISTANEPTVHERARRRQKAKREGEKEGAEQGGCEEAGEAGTLSCQPLRKFGWYNVE